MEKEKQEEKHTIMVSDMFERTDEKHRYEIPFRRWLVREIEEGRLKLSEAVTRFNFNPKSGFHLIKDWRRKYAPEMVIALPGMTEQEKQHLDSLQKQVKALEKPTKSKLLFPLGFVPLRLRLRSTTPRGKSKDKTNNN